jgi:hypothetical protein
MKKKKEKNYNDYCHTFGDYVGTIACWIAIVIMAAFVILIIAGLCVSYQGPGTKAYEEYKKNPRIEVPKDTTSIKKDDNSDSPLRTIVPIVIANIVTSPNFNY